MHLAGSASQCNDKPKLAPLQSELLDIVIGAQRNGAKDLTATEIQRVREQRLGHRVSDGSVAGCVSGLVRLGYLQRATEKRLSVFPGASKDVAAPVFVPLTQARLLA